MQKDENKVGVALNMVPQEVLKTERFEIDPNDFPVFAVPKDRDLVDVTEIVRRYEKLGLAPLRRRGVFKAATVGSFLGWMKQNAPEESPVFASGAEKLNGEWKNPKLALIGIGNYSAGGIPQWHDFRAEYSFPVTSAWQTWCSKHGVWMTQADFAEFIEDHIWELTLPKEDEGLSESVTRFIEALALQGTRAKWASPSELFQLSRELKIATDAKLESKINLQSGEAKLIYTSENKGEGGQPIVIPNLFFIRIPVFFGFGSSLIGVRLRYRAAGGAVLWQATLFAPDLIVEETFCRVVDQVEKDYPVFEGSPDYSTA